MITGTFSRWHEYRHILPDAFEQAMQFLMQSAAHPLQAGKHAIDGERIFVSVQQTCTEPLAQRRFELHSEYIDIQTPLSGREMHGYAVLPPTVAALEDRLNSDDVAFYPCPSQKEGFQTLHLYPGQYAIYFPGELHCPCCAIDAPENILKAVCKIHVSCIDGSPWSPSL